MMSRTLATGIVGGAVLGALVGALPTAPAHAAQGVLSGAYQESDATGYTTWTFTPCGADCTAATYTTADGTVLNPTFHLSDGSWTATAPMELPCARDGSTVSAQMSYELDADTLTGDMSTTLMVTGCGRFAGTTTAPNSFKLAKIG